MNKVQLEVMDVSQGSMSHNPFIMILKETNGNRKLSIMVGAMEAQSILVCLRNVKVARPLSHDLFTSLMDSFSISLQEILIYKVVDGIYYSLLIVEQDGQIEEIDARTSDAVALALRCDVPIYTWEGLIEREHIYEDGSGAISIPVSSVNIDTLKEALNRARNDENYELAAQLRDEIARREQQHC